jgi:hypothetical protein
MFANKCVFVLCSSKYDNNSNSTDNMKRYVQAPKRSINALMAASTIETINIGDLPTDKFPEIDDIQFDTNGEHIDTISIIDMSFVSAKCIETYLKQYGSNDSTFENYIITVMMNSVLLSSYDSMERKIRRSNLLKSSEELLYWQLPNNCKIDITKQYLDRNVTLKSYRKIKLDNEFVSSNTALEDKALSDYLDNMLNYTSRYVDAALTRTYFPIVKNEDQIIDHDIITRLLTTNMIGSYETVLLVITVMCMPQYCHLIVNNKSALEYIESSDMFKQSNSYPVESTYDQIMQHAWLSLYMEESIKKSNIKQSDRFIFDINTASALPFLTKPFLTVMIDNDVPTLKKNLHPPGWDTNHKLGVCTFNTFKQRMNIFISGENKSLLDELDWSRYALCGSMMACCTPLFNPLMLNISQDENFDENHENFDRFAVKYYSDADIDVAIKGTIPEFINSVYAFRNVLENSIRKLFPDEVSAMDAFRDDVVKYDSKLTKLSAPSIEDTDVVKPKKRKRIKHTKIINSSSNIVRINYIKQANITINNEFIRENFFTLDEIESLCSDTIEVDDELDITSNNSELDNTSNNSDSTQSPKINDTVLIDKYVEIIENINRMDHNDSSEINRIIQIVYDVYLAFQENENENVDKVLLEYHDIVDKSNIRIFMATSSADIQNTSCVARCGCTFKYRVSCKLLKHDFELFKIRGDEFFGSISQFHFPIVRSYYCGTNVYMTPTCITACKTLINIDYKFFAGIKDPALIWIKYYFRGFGFLFNNNELKKLISFCIQNPSVAARFVGINFNQMSNIKTLLSRHKYDNVYEGQTCSEWMIRDFSLTHGCQNITFPHHKKGSVMYLKLDQLYSTIPMSVFFMNAKKTKNTIVQEIVVSDDPERPEQTEIIVAEDEDDDSPDNWFLGENSRAPYVHTDKDIDNMIKQFDVLNNEILNNLDSVSNSQNSDDEIIQPSKTIVINAESDDESDISEPEPVYPRNIAKKSAKKRIDCSSVESESESESEDDEEPRRNTTKKSVKKKSIPAPEPELDDESESDEEEVIEELPRRKTTKKCKKSYR